MKEMTGNEKQIMARCIKTNCFFCAEGDKYKEIAQCPHFSLKQIALEMDNSRNGN